MKKLFFALALIFCSTLAFAQLEDGTYTYSNAEIKLNFTIAEGGFVIYEISLTNVKTGEKLEGSGSWFMVNQRATGANTAGWYQLETEFCNFDFDVPVNELILNQHDCKDGSASRKYTLTKK